MHFVYILYNKASGKYYIGYTADIDRRIKEHRKDKPEYELVYSEKRSSESDALKRETYFKSGNGRRALKVLLKQ